LFGRAGLGHQPLALTRLRGAARHGPDPDHLRHPAAALGVFLQVGLGGQFWINILLTLLGYIPGIVHAVWIIARR
jgi:uncharacterized membrane protein YqaE (UPF0057 family)